MSPYPHSDALDYSSTKAPADNSHGHPAGESDRTPPGASTVPGNSISRLPSTNYYIGYALLDDIPRLHTRSRSLPWSCSHSQPGGNPLRNFCDFRRMTVLNSSTHLPSACNTHNPNYCDLPLMRDTATSTALRMNLYRSGHSTTYTVMGACDYYATYGVAPKSFLVFPTDLAYDDEEAALYLSIYNELPLSYIHNSDHPDPNPSSYGHRPPLTPPVVPKSTRTPRALHPDNTYSPQAHLTNPLIFMMHTPAQSTNANRSTNYIHLESRHQIPPVHDTIRDFVRRETITLLTDQPTETYVQSLRRQQQSLLDAQIAENQRIDQQLLDLDRESRRL